MVHTHTHLHTYTPTRLHAYTPTHLHTYTPTHTHAPTNPPTHTHNIRWLDTKDKLRPSDGFDTDGTKAYQSYVFVGLFEPLHL